MTANYFFDCIFPILNEPLIDPGWPLVISLDRFAWQECHRLYHTTPGYSFKITLVAINLQQQWLLVHNETGHLILKVFDETVKSTTFYPAGLQLNLTTIGKQSQDSIIFTLTISVIKLPALTMSHQCPIPMIAESNIIWSIFDSIRGYAPSLDCRLKIEPKATEAVFFTVFPFLIEYNSDQLLLRTDNGSWTDLSNYVSVENIALMLFVPASTEQEIEFCFRSDDTIQLPGFQLTAMLADCKCKKFVASIPCEGNFSMDAFTDYPAILCNTTGCSVTLTSNPKCPEKYPIVELVTKAFAVNVYVNEMKLGNYTRFPSMQIPLNPGDIITMRFARVGHLTFDSLGCVKVSAHFLPTPTVKRVILNETNPGFVLILSELAQNSVTFVELSQTLQDDILEMYSTVSDPLFTASTNSIYCHVVDEKFYFASKWEDISWSMVASYNGANFFPVNSTAFAIVNINSVKTSNQYVYVRARKMQAKGCVFDDNVGGVISRTYSFIASSHASCSAIFVDQDINGMRFISALWSNSENQQDPILFRNFLHPSKPIVSFTDSVISALDFVAFDGFVFELEVPARVSTSFEMSFLPPPILTDCTHTANMIFAINAKMLPYVYNGTFKTTTFTVKQLQNAVVKLKSGPSADHTHLLSHVDDAVDLSDTQVTLDLVGNVTRYSFAVLAVQATCLLPADPKLTTAISHASKFS